jgi:hypothetical protein
MEATNLKTFKNKYLNHTLLISGVLAAIFLILKFGLGIERLSYSSIFIILFFLILSNVLFYLQIKVANERIIRFVNRFMVITGLKLVGFLFIILAYGFFDREGVVSFAIAFLVVYFTFSIFEVIHILKIQKLLTK